MEFEKAYEKLLKQHNIEIKDLPEDARFGIGEINKVLHFIKMQEKSEKPVSEKTLSKLKTLDRWVVREILDYVDDKDSEQGDLPTDAKTIIADEKKDDNIEPPVKKDDEPVNVVKDPKGFAIDKELETLFKANKLRFTMEELKAAAPTAEGVVFDNYTPDGENGIVTSHYKLVETEKEVFTLSKK